MNVDLGTYYGTFPHNEGVFCIDLPFQLSIYADCAFEGENAFTYSDPQRRLYFSSWFAGSPLGFIEGSHKWLYWPYRDSVLQYDLAADPDEQSPVRVGGVEKDRIVSELIEWQQRSQFVIHPRRFRQRLLFEHWRTFSSGRLSWTYYVP